ncbi:MAG: hypothetical protein PVI21_03025 [Candidatus Woesebacteria bacterium]|jgi:hypothetical protein
MTQDPQNVRTQVSFSDDIAQISLSHVLEIMKALQSYKEGLSIVGGWAPYFLLRQYQHDDNDFEHVGSIDIDIAVNPEVINETQYAQLEELLRGRGYEPHPKIEYSYYKNVKTSDGREVEIRIDFLAPEYGGTGRAHRNQRVQNDFLARKAKGADLAFEHRFEFTLNDRLPNGADASVSFYVADIVAMIAMKSYVLGHRYKEKDAYDIFSLVLHYKDGVESVAAEVKPFIADIPLPEGIDNLKEQFATQSSQGPASVADFHRDEGESREQRTQQAYLQIQRLLELLENG